MSADRRRKAELAQVAVAVVVAGLLVWFALANDQRVSVDFLITTRDSPSREAPARRDPRTCGMPQ